MARTTELVRTYATRDDFTLDEQVLGQQGWSVQSTVREQQQGLLHRIRSLFSSTPAPAPIVVTYYRPNPS